MPCRINALLFQLQSVPTLLVLNRYENRSEQTNPASTLSNKVKRLQELLSRVKANPKPRWQ